MIILFENFNLGTLEKKRFDFDLILLLWAHFRRCDVFKLSIFSSNALNTRWNNPKVSSEKLKCNNRRYSYFRRAAKIWNDITRPAVSVFDIRNLRRQLDSEQTRAFEIIQKILFLWNLLGIFIHFSLLMFNAEL